MKTGLGTIQRQDQKIEAHGKNIFDVMFHGRTNEAPIPAIIKVDVSDVASQSDQARGTSDWHTQVKCDS